MPSHQETPDRGKNTLQEINDNKLIDASTPTPTPWVSLSCRRNRPSLTLSIQEQYEIFNRISDATEGQPTSSGQHILRHARIVEYIKSYTSARERDGQQREATQWGAGVPVPVLGTHPLSHSHSLLAAFQDAGILLRGSGETLPGMIADEHSSEYNYGGDDNHLGSEEEEDEILFMRRTSNHTSNSWAGTITRSRYGILGTTEGEGKDGSDDDSDSDGGAPLSGPSKYGDSMDENDGDESDGGAPLSGSFENGRLGNDRCEGGSDGRLDGSNRIDLAQFAATHHQQFQHGLRVNLDRKADAQLTHHRRPDTPVPAFRSGVQIGARSDAGADADPEFFSTVFLFQRAEARARLRVLNRFSSLDHPERINGLQDGGQQARQRLQHQNSDGTSISNADHLTSNTRHHSHSHEPKSALGSIISKFFHFPLPTPKLPSPSSSSRSVPAQSSTLPPRALLLSYELQGNRTTNQVPKPPTPTTSTGDTTTGDSTPITGNSTPSSAQPSSSHLGPFPLSPSTIALLASSQASLERLTTPKFHPGFSRFRQNRSQEAQKAQAQAQAEASTATWTSIDIGPGPKKKKEKKEKKEKEEGEDEEEEEDWEWLDNPCDEYRIGRIYNPGKGRGYARNGGFGRREMDELPGGLEEVCMDYGSVLDRNGNGEGSSSSGGLQHQHQHQHLQTPIPIPLPPLHRDITRNRGITRSGTPSTSTTSQTQTHLATSRLRQTQTERESTSSTSLSRPSSYTLSRPSMSASSPSPYTLSLSGEVGVGVGVAGRERSEDERRKAKGKEKGKWKGKERAETIDQERHGIGREVAPQPPPALVRNSLERHGHGYGYGPDGYWDRDRDRDRDRDQGSNSTFAGRNQERERRREDARTYTVSGAQHSGRPRLDDSVNIDEGFADVRPGRVTKKQ